MKKKGKLLNLVLQKCLFVVFCVVLFFRICFKLKERFTLNVPVLVLKRACEAVLLAEENKSISSTQITFGNKRTPCTL